MTSYEAEFRALHKRANEAMDNGALADASRDFAALSEEDPSNRFYHYMLGLACKYRFDWEPSLRHNLRAIELADDAAEGEHWNAAIAATALGEWTEARRL